MREWACDFIANLYAESYTDMMLNDAIQNAMGSGEGSASEACSAVLSFCINTILPALSSVGLAIAITFFLLAMIDLASSERLTMEFFIKFFTKLVVSIVLISFCGKLVTACMNFGDGITGILSTALEGGEGGYTYEEIYKAYYESAMASDNSWIAMIISAFLSVGIIGIVSKALVVVVYFVAFTRMLEMGVRGAMMPIALGLLSDDGWRGSGGRYIRKFLAICSQGAVLMLIGTISNVAMLSCSTSVLNLEEGATSSGLGGFLIILGLAFATVSLMFKSIGIVNDVFGG